MAQYTSKLLNALFKCWYISHRKDILHTRIFKFRIFILMWTTHWLNVSILINSSVFSNQVKWTRNSVKSSITWATKNAFSSKNLINQKSLTYQTLASSQCTDKGALALESRFERPKYQVKTKNTRVIQRYFTKNSSKCYIFWQSNLLGDMFSFQILFFRRR